MVEIARLTRNLLIKNVGAPLSNCAVVCSRDVALVEVASLINKSLIRNVEARLSNRAVAVSKVRQGPSGSGQQEGGLGRDRKSDKKPVHLEC